MVFESVKEVLEKDNLLDNLSLYKVACSYPLSDDRLLTWLKNKDIVICGDVSHGSEIMASGNIFIYGALNGKAIAGADGDEGAQIFCQEFQPELISIAGTYIVCDDISSEFKAKSVSARMHDKKISLSVFGNTQSVVDF